MTAVFNNQLLRAQYEYAYRLCRVIDRLEDGWIQLKTFDDYTRYMDDRALRAARRSYRARRQTFQTARLHRSPWFMRQNAIFRRSILAVYKGGRHA